MSVTGTAVLSSAAVGSYIDQSDIENRFGTDNVAKWSNLDNSNTVADGVRIQAAIYFAEEEINNRFRRSRYTVPFSGTIPYKVKEWAAILAGWWLYTSRGLRDDDVEGDRLEKLAAKVKDEWALTLSGRLHLDVADSFSDAPSAPHIVGGES